MTNTKSFALFMLWLTLYYLYYYYYYDFYLNRRTKNNNVKYKAHLQPFNLMLSAFYTTHIFIYKVII